MGRKGTMSEKEIDSIYLNETITVKSYKPESFSHVFKYHICIMQDGDDYFQLGRVATLSDSLHDDGTIENTVFVGIQYNDKYDRQDKYHPNGSKQKLYMQFLVKEVIPLIEAELPTYHVSGSRTLMGDSLAGTVSLMTALRYPNTFGQVIMQSPYVDDKVLDTVASAKGVETVSIYHTIGDQETEVETTSGERQDFLTPNRELTSILEEKGLSYTYHELEGKHTWKYWQKDLKRALPAMFGN